MSSPRRVQSRQPRRIAMLSVHTSPLDQPGTGDAGGMNVYVVETARRLAERGTEVEIFTRATSGTCPGYRRARPGRPGAARRRGSVRGAVEARPPRASCAPSPPVCCGSRRARTPAGTTWCTPTTGSPGQVGWLAADRWHVPLVHTMHTMAKVKNLSLAEGDTPEPAGRVIGEEQVVGAADRLVANTAEEARQLVGLYAADPGRLAVVPPGVDLEVFRPGCSAAAAARGSGSACRCAAQILLFVGRIQPLKAPDVLVRAAARMLRADPGRRERLTVVVLGGPSGTGLEQPEGARTISPRPRASRTSSASTLPSPRTELADWYRAADVSSCRPTASPSGSSPSRPRPAARRSSRPGSGACRRPWGRRDGVARRRPRPGGLGGCAARTPGRAGAAAAHGGCGRGPQPPRFGWDATVDALLDVYEGALADAGPAIDGRPVRPARCVPVGDLAVAP